MTENTFKDLCLCGETTRVQFKEAFTSQKEIAKEMIKKELDIEQRYIKKAITNKIVVALLSIKFVLFCNLIQKNQ